MNHHTDQHVLGVKQSLTGRHWRLRPTDATLVSDLMHQHNLSDLVARLLAGRGVTLENSSQYLAPRLKTSFPDPSSFADMDKASHVILKALNENRKIAILADYDADGGCAAALMIRYMRCWGLEAQLHVPDRLTEGYGPTVHAFDTLKRNGVELVITVDCGANAIRALAHADNIGMDVVVLDHHLMLAKMPPARAIVNPNRPDCRSGCGYLAGVGVVLILIVAVNRLARSMEQTQCDPLPDPRQWLDICALGTICDVVPLVGLNRTIVAHGLILLGKCKNPGIAALANKCRIACPDTTDDIAFGLGPRINAGGRLGDQTLGARLLTSDDPKTVATIAEQLETANDMRKNLEAQITLEAFAEAEKQLDNQPQKGILTVAGHNWHPGVIGIVASRLRDRFCGPVIVIGWADEFGPLARGSARSVPGVAIGNIVANARKSGHVLDGGGHAAAAGLSLDPKNIPELVSYMANPELFPDQTRHNALALTVDTVIAAGSAQSDIMDQINRLAPFGAGAPAPVIALANLRTDAARRVGRDHIAFTAHGNDGGQLRCIAFRHADRAIGQAVFNRSVLHLAGKLRSNSWRGPNNVQLEIADAAIAQ